VVGPIIGGVLGGLGADWLLTAIDWVKP
jgi:glycerol uptake facilitator-like aquaporin